MRSYVSLIFLITVIVYKSHCEDEHNLIEDITMDDDDQQTFPTPPPIGTTTVERSQNYQIFNEHDMGHRLNKDQNPYANRKSTRPPENRSDFKKAREEASTQVIAGIPDVSDPCFRRYENSIIVNAQPYERRSSTGLIHCKSHCLTSQSGAFSCRSFVYDNINRVCDLFAHVGDQAPARLLKFQTRDYYEPTNAVQCLSMVQPSENIDGGLPPSIPTPPQDQIVSMSSNSAGVQREEPAATEPASIDNNKCPPGKNPTFLRTEGFELFKYDDEQMVVSDLSECSDACKANQINGKYLDCKSFDFLTTTSTCSFTTEAAVPVGNGQLKQRDEASYHEKICVTESVVSQCSSDSFFTRFPQMILVGFAESVADSPNFEHCFDTCLNSFQLFGFNCTSGMYYFEESQLNCILNSENRNTQKDLFTEENTDIVDYFEIDCNSQGASKKSKRRRIAGVRNFETDPIGAEKMIVPTTNHMVSTEDEENGSRWESWSECVDGKQTRRRSCSNFIKMDDCAEEVRDCEPAGIKMSVTRHENHEKVPTKLEIAAVKRKIKKEGFHCQLNHCCRVFSSCTYGLRHNSTSKQLEWCRRSCDEPEDLDEYTSSSFARKRARLL